MDINVLKEMLPIIAKGSIITVELTVFSLIIGSILGIIVALSKLVKNKVIFTIASLYTWLFRGTPIILQLFVLYYGLPAIGIKFTPFEAAIMGLSLNSGAYMAEIIRGGILSVDKGQFEACKALGFTYFDTMRRIILPQTVRIIIPSIGNEFITLLKDTSIVSTIAMVEIMRSSQQLYASSFKPMEAFFIAGCLYLFLTTIFTTIFAIYEKKLAMY